MAEQRSQKEVIEESIKILKGMEKELSHDKIIFDDCDIPGNKSVNCPMERVENRLHIDYRQIGCPLDRKQKYQIFDSWVDSLGCFERCEVFEKSGQTIILGKNAFENTISEIQNAIKRLKDGKYNQDTNRRKDSRSQI